MKHTFKTLGISEEMCNALEKQRITEPTPVQEQGIPAILSGLDVIAQAQTGTGKTLAFLLPIFDAHKKGDSTVEALVVTPTRELAIQIASEARKLAHDKPMNILEAYGGKDIQVQINKLKGNVHLVIGTPGRILDHIRRGTVSLKNLKTLVLDEADQMLHIGFLPEVEAIINHTPKERQTLCLSATMPAGVRSLANRFMKKPVTVSVRTQQVTLEIIKQQVIETTDREKQAALFQFIDETKPFMAIIFCRTRRRVTGLFQAMQAKGYSCDEIHGELTQGKREKVMKEFRNMKTQFLVATDVAARGLDIDGITHIFNYDIALDAESYIHRIGRTGRAGNAGASITFVTSKDRGLLAEIEREIGMKLPKTEVRVKLGHGETHMKPAEHQKHRAGDRGRGGRGDRSEGTGGRDRNGRSGASAGKSDRPSYGKSAHPASGGSDRPSYGKSARPASGGSDRPSYGKTVGPASGGSDRPSYGKSARPASGSSDRPSYGKSARPAAGSSDRPAHGKPSRPSSGKPTRPSSANSGRPSSGKSRGGGRRP